MAMGDMSRIDQRSARLMRILTALQAVPEAVAHQDSGTASEPTGTGGRLNSSGHEAHSLVVEFDEAYTAFIDGFVDLPSESQMVALQAVDTKLSAMVDAKDAALWTARARREDPIWIEVRELAAEVIGEFGWPTAVAAAPIH